ncbi:pre-miRNA 5'-monophosphate methyltransferase-like [Amphiura filiformis]|uniref:pre-miRNA 5'-monophosphate methyltransferase-like n=1 Tax=Amphiura filiformis TaxID=82378 RepID=UPI003B20E636
MAAPSVAKVDGKHMGKQSTFHPGAAPYGNFINYYTFNPPIRRLQFIPTDMLDRILDAIKVANHDAVATVLDVGCNTGDLTIALYEHLLKGGVPEVVKQTSEHACEETSSEKPPEEGHQVDADDSGKIKPDQCDCVNNSHETKCEGKVSGSKQLFMLGCDIDQVLIQRATEANPYPDNVMFQAIDIMDSTSSNKVCANFLDAHHASHIFDLTTCFSITMWIHLHQGDSGLLTFLEQVSKRTRYLIIEPQPWKCYKSAVRRVKKLGQPMQWQSLSELQIREDVVDRIVKHLVTECNMEIVQRLGETDWERQLLLLRNSMNTV